ncbi:MAG: methyltransferase domain-containing protein [Bacillota bacterium]
MLWLKPIGDLDGLWDDTWLEQTSPEKLTSWVTRQRVFKVITNHLPDQAKVVEAGCGLGHWVCALRQCGYNAVGIDTSRVGIENGRRLYNLNQDILREGNVLALEYLDNSFDAYVSLGVVEHFLEGPVLALKEAHRVLKEGGLLFCSVPYLNLLRIMFTERFDPNMSDTSGYGFYQWSFTKEEMEATLKSAGFEVIRIFPYATIKTFWEVIPGFRSVTDRIMARATAVNASNLEKAKISSPRPSVTIKSLLKGSAALLLEGLLTRKLAGHMCMYVCKKKRGSRL